MSSIPGYTLEEFLAWEYNLVVEDLGEVNVSMGLAEVLGTATYARRTLTKEEFSKLVELYEPSREVVESALLDYDEEENGSWRTYGCYVLNRFYLEAELKVLSQHVQNYLATIGKKQVVL